MAQIPSDQAEDNKHLRKAFIPTLTESAVLLLGSFFFLLAVNSLPAFRSLDGERYTLVMDYIKSWIEKILAPTNNQQGSTILTLVFWMVMGIIAYVIIWLCMSLWKAYKDDLTRTKGMVLPKGFSNKKVFHESVLRLLVKVLSTIVFLYWLYLLLASILPYASFTFLQSITDLSLKSVGNVAWATFVAALSVFVAMVFARCIVLRERVFKF